MGALCDDDMRPPLLPLQGALAAWMDGQCGHDDELHRPGLLPKKMVPPSRLLRDVSAGRRRDVASGRDETPPCRHAPGRCVALTVERDLEHSRSWTSLFRLILLLRWTQPLMAVSRTAAERSGRAADLRIFAMPS